MITFLTLSTKTPALCNPKSSFVVNSRGCPKLFQINHLLNYLLRSGSPFLFGFVVENALKKMFVHQTSFGVAF